LEIGAPGLCKEGSVRFRGIGAGGKICNRQAGLVGITQARARPEPSFGLSRCRLRG